MDDSTATRPGQAMLHVLLLVMLMLLGSGCSGAANDASPDASPSTPRVLTAEEANRLAASRFNLYRGKTVAVTSTIATGADVLTLEGWIDTVRHQGYGLVTPRQEEGFLSVWNKAEVSAQGYAGVGAPLPPPRTGWTTMALSAGDSALAAAQLILVNLSSDRPDNPQLLLQSGAQWLRSDSVAGVDVDVMSGPVTAGDSTSSLRYWVDGRGVLHRIEARLNGRDWSVFTFAAAADVTF